jgi:Tfp pilus assembly protein PilN
MIRIDLQIPMKGLGRNAAIRRNLTLLRETFTHPAVLAFAILVVGLGAFAVFLQRQAEDELSRVKAQMQTAIQDSTRLEVDIAKSNEFRLRQQEMSNQVVQIEAVDRNRFAFVHIMDQASAALPAGSAWIRKIETKTQDAMTGRITFVLHGTAASDEVVTRYQQALEASPFIVSVQFLGSDTKLMNDQPVVEFSLEGSSDLPDRSFLQTETINADGSTERSSRPAPSSFPGMSAPTYPEGEASILDSGALPAVPQIGQPLGAGFGAGVVMGEPAALPGTPPTLPAPPSAPVHQP